MDLPKFKYHPNPLATGSIQPSEVTCECCGKARGYIYSSVLYAEEEVESVCPWCISDGSAASNYGGSFVDDYPLRRSGLPEEVIFEVCERTPGYNSWQQEQWQSHCNDACEFHGDAEKSDLESLSGSKLDEFLRKELIEPDFWEQILEGYVKGGSPAVYNFRCRKCHEFIYSMDFA